MNHSEEETDACPLGAADCVKLDELVRARDEVNRLEQQVHTDALTGLYNYRHFSRMMEQEWERTRRSGQPTALVMVDLDHFKQVNDRWGHETGNRVLAHCARLMAEMLRKIDIPCRYGGEEFALILPSTSLPRAVSAASRLRVAIEQTPLELDGSILGVTASMGVNVYRRHDALDIDAFIEQTDRYLYRAKQAGRNRVCHPDFSRFRSETQVSREEKDALFRPDGATRKR
ncbi:MAG TPA: GGDEF domain-containing protein [Sedimenticola sp.]|nr:GGDEF domain-containing protein [Sedimenticola sp.]